MRNTGFWREFFMKKKKKWPLIVLAVVAVVVILSVVMMSSAANKLKQKVYVKYDAKIDDITTTIAAGGTLCAEDYDEIEIPDGVEITEVLVSKGDKVSAGDKLAEIDHDSAKIKASELAESLAGIEAQIAMAQKGEKTSVSSGVKGVVKAIYANEGDNVTDIIAENGSLMVIAVDGDMCIDIATEEDIAIGEIVSVKWADNEADGEVYLKTKDSIRVVLDDETAPYLENADVYHGDTKIGTGVLEILNKVGVYAEGGVIKEEFYEVNDRVSAGSKLFTLDNGALSLSYMNLIESREDTAEQLETVLKLVNHPYIVAEHDGVVYQINAEGGAERTAATSSAQSDDYSMNMMSMMGQSSLSSGGAASTAEISSTAAFVMEVGGVTKMTVSVDELDISTVAVGQKAEITVDAFPKDLFEAEVTAVSSVGDVSGSMTNYSVELTLKADERLLSGMNGSAVIVSDSVENVVAIPVEAINEDADGEYVYVSATGDVNGKDNKMVRITTGLSDGEYVEVKEGLSEGDKVMYIKTGTTMFEQMMAMREEMMGGGDA